MSCTVLLSPQGLKGKQPMVGHMFKMEYIFGAVYRPTFDINKHFTTFDRYETVPWQDRVKWIFLWMWSWRGVVGVY